jgi:hypothetical protein
MKLFYLLVLACLVGIKGRSPEVSGLRVTAVRSLGKFPPKGKQP